MFVTGEQVKGFVIGTVKQAVLNLIGSNYPDIDDAYKVSIITVGADGKEMNKSTYLLQNEIQLNVASQWSSFIPFGELLKTGIASNVGLFTTGHTFQTAITSRRVWIGTDPVAIRLDLVLLSDEDTNADVVDKVRFIQGLALPSEPAGAGSWLVPPGPSPFKLNPNDSTNFMGKFEGENINIAVGNFLLFRNVIVQSVEAKFENRMSSSTRKPTAAKISVIFETYQILTKEELARIYDKSLGSGYNSLGYEFLKNVRDDVGQQLNTVKQAVGKFFTGGQ